MRKLRGRVMPPPGSQAARRGVGRLAGRLARELTRSRGRAGKAHVPDRLVLHRLNRKEYANAVRDLLAVEFDADAVLPADDVAEGFDNIAAALQVSPSFIEQYVIAARAVAVKAIGRPDARPGGWTFRAGPGTQLTHVPGLPLGTRGGILANVDLPSDGEYIIDIADMATHIWGNGMEFENPLVVTLDNKLIYETVIGGEEDMKLYDQVQNGALDRVNARLKNIKFFDDRGTAQDRRDVQAPDVRRVRRSAADVLARRRSGSSLSRELVPGARAVRRQGTQSDAEPRAHLRLQAGGGRDRRCAGRMREADHRVARQARLPATGHAPRTSTSCSSITRTASKAGRLRGRRPQRRHRSAGEPVLPVSQRARPGRSASRCHLRHQRSRAGVEAVVLPLEHDPR